MTYKKYLEGKQKILLNMPEKQLQPESGIQWIVQNNLNTKRSRKFKEWNFQTINLPDAFYRGEEAGAVLKPLQIKLKWSTKPAVFETFDCLPMDDTESERVAGHTHTEPPHSCFNLSRRLTLSLVPLDKITI